MLIKRFQEVGGSERSLKLIKKILKILIIKFQQVGGSEGSLKKKQNLE